MITAEVVPIAGAQVGSGLDRWSAAHVLDTARLFRLALEAGRAGARHHATAEGGIPVRDIAEAIGKRLGLPVVSIQDEDVQAHFGWLAAFVSQICPHRAP